MIKNLNNPRRIRFDAELEKTIERMDIDFSKAVRRLCRQALSGTNHQDFSALFEQLEKTRKQLSPIGSNLNQIAFGFNTDGHLYGESLSNVHSELQKQFADVMRILKVIKNNVIDRIS
ncbi:hypothetical protein [Methylophaga sp.]|uniref:hypothetical protein n=1 Tax=Methylophaga sp. TaxID=2024840 RepID=UPI003A91DE46